MLVGAVLGAAADRVSGRAVTPAGSTPVLVTERGERLNTTPIFVMPGVDLEARFGDVHLRAGIAAAFVASPGPHYKGSLLGVDATGCTRARFDAPSCAPAQKIIAAEQVFRPFAAVAPSLALGYRF